MPRTETKANPVTLDDLMKEIRTSTEVSKAIKSDLKKLTGSVKDNSVTMKNYMDKTNKVIGELQKENTALNEKVKTLEDSVTVVSDQLTEAESKLKEHDQHIKLLLTRNKAMEEERRRQNIIVEGLKEDANTPPKQQIMEMLSDIGADIVADDVTVVTRLGPGGRAKASRPRATLVKFANVNKKHELYKHVKNLGQSDKWKYIRIQDDLPVEIQNERKEMRCLAALARDRGHNATMKGNALIVDDIRYLYKDLDDLPEGINMTNAKLVKLEDGWAFQSHHAFCSNMAKCNIRYKEIDFTSSEQVYWYKCAEEAEPASDGEGARIPKRVRG